MLLFVQKISAVVFEVCFLLPLGENPSLEVVERNQSVQTGIERVVSMCFEKEEESL